MTPDQLAMVRDPLRFAKSAWPDVQFYKQQRQVILSVRDNDETFCVAGNQLGKDFLAGYTALWFFISRAPARVVSTSVKLSQLEDVLWGEIRRFLKLAAIPLPIQYNHMKIRRVDDEGNLWPNAELVGQVSNTQEGLLGRHSAGGFRCEEDQTDIPRTLVIFDEASSISDEIYNSVQTWAQRKLIIGNPFQCENFFKRGVLAGDLPRELTAAQKAAGYQPGAAGYHRKVIRITAEDSPNVRLARKELSEGKEPSNRVLIPGVKTWAKYQQDRNLWDKELQTIGLDAEFFEGAASKLFPPDWLRRCNALADQLKGRSRTAVSIGIDPAEGGDKTAMCAVDGLGVIELVSRKTPNTADIPREAIAFGQRHGVPPQKWMFDRGGGGKQHADRLREMGFKVDTVPFGAAPNLEPKRGLHLMEDRKEVVEDRSVYKNLRAQMYYELSQLCDPSIGAFAIPRDADLCSNGCDLSHQLGVIPRVIGPEGVLELPPKNKRDGQIKVQSLVDLIGHSPDEADALVLAVYGMLHVKRRMKAGAI